ncbi:MAG: STAS domain-containing protein [Pseudomonadota bacterium]
MITHDGDRLQLTGRLTIEAVPALAKSDLWPAGSTDAVIDLAQAEAVDSATVSLLLSWLRRAQREHVTLCFANVPENLSSLIQLYDVTDMLPLCGEPAGQP